MNPSDENVARVRWPRHRDGAERRSARRIAMQARRRQAREMGCLPPFG
jgi:hypothetical protein